MSTRRIRKMGGSKYTHYLKNKKPLNVREKKQVKRIINSRIEKKYYDSLLSAQTVTYNGTLQDLCLIPLSTSSSDDTKRVGDQVIYYRMEINYAVFNATATTTNMVRVILFQWKQYSTPTIGNILLNNNPDLVGTADAPLAFYNHDQRGLYNIIYDRRHNLNYTNTYFTSKHLVLKSKRIRKKIQYIANSTNGYNHIYFLIISDDGAISYPTYSFASRITYMDA